MFHVLWIVVGWLVREVLIKFVVLAGLFGAISALAPIITANATSVITGTDVSTAFSALPAGLWYFLDWFRVGYGVPLVIAAYGTRFVMRRVPLIG